MLFATMWREMKPESTCTRDYTRQKGRRADAPHGDPASQRVLEEETKATEPSSIAAVKQDVSPVRLEATTELVAAPVADVQKVRTNSADHHHHHHHHHRGGFAVMALAPRSPEKGSTGEAPQALPRKSSGSSSDDSKCSLD